MGRARAPTLPNLRAHTLSSVLACCLALAPTPALPLPPSDAAPSGKATALTLERLIERALSKGLDAHPAWLALGHYEATLFGWRTRASESFLLSPEGGRSPRLELVATLRAFVENDAERPPDERARCRFPARFRWLDQELGLGLVSAQAGVANDCPDYEAWKSALDVHGASLIFPEGFMENPASMFGHTLLRLDTGIGTADGTGTGARVSQHDLLGHAVDFTAAIGDDGAAIYLVKGIAGLYPGSFNVSPYHAQLRRYTDWENRDIWEYRLRLEASELEFLMAHLWELKSVDFPYLFFTDNCSHQLIALLKVVRPQLERVAGMPPTVIPADTVRSLMKLPEFVDGIRYRASPASELRQMLDSLARDERRLVRRIAAGTLEPGTLEAGTFEAGYDSASSAGNNELAKLSPERQGAVLEAAYKTLRYEYLAGGVSEEHSRGLSRRILLARSKLPNAPESGSARDSVRLELLTPGAPPHLGHGSARLALAGGVDDGVGYLDLLFRPAYHDLMDADAGYTKDMQVEFLAGRLRYYPALNRVRLQDLSLVEVLSLNPRSRVFRPVAWRFETGLRTREVSRKGSLHERSVWRTAGGVGLAFDPLPWILAYGLADVTLDASPSLDPGASFGPGAMIGAYLRPAGDRFRTHLHARITYFGVGEKDTVLRAGIEERVSIGRNLAIVFEASFNRARSHDWFAGGGSLRLYF